MSELLIGADPEFFVTDGKGHIVPAVGMVGGTKYEPLACLRGAMQVDGLALEFNIEPAKTAAEFDKAVRGVMMRTLREARNNTGNTTLRPSKGVVHEFSEDEWEKIPEESKELGCSASYNIGGAIAGRNSERHGRTRVVGGHVHIGWGEGLDTSIGSIHYRDCLRMARVCDVMVQGRIMAEIILHVRASSKAMELPFDLHEEYKRKSYYGAWTEFRPKPYGIEYRSMSNFWIKNSDLRKKVFEYTTEAFEVAKLWDELQLENRIVDMGNNARHAVHPGASVFYQEQAIRDVKKLLKLASKYNPNIK